MSLESLLVIALGLGAGALCKGVTGMGLPLFALPVLASFLEMPHAIAVMALPLIASNAWQVASFRRHAGPVDFLPRMVLVGALGIAVGTVFLKTAPGEALSVAFGLMLLIYLGLRLAHPSLKLPLAAARRISAPVSLAAGMLQGTMGIAAPIIVTFLDSMRLERGAYIFTISVVYFSYAALQFAALAVAGLVTGPILLEGLFALVPIAVFMPLGALLGRHLRPELFDRVVQGLLALIALRFIAKGLGWL